MQSHSDCRDFDYITTTNSDGLQHVWMSRLTCGCVMCCVCFDYTHPNRLYVDDDGQKWDYCKQCDHKEKQFLIKRASWWNPGAWRFDTQDGENRD